MRSKSFFFGEENAWEEVGNGITRQITGFNKEIMMVKVRFEEGSIGSMHTHYHSQTTFVAEGSFEFTIGGESRIVSQGDALFIAPDEPHGTRCLQRGMLIDVFSPHREDFIDGTTLNYFK